MGPQYTLDTTAADWLERSGLPWARLVTFGPAGFAAYARLRFIPDPTEPGQRESDVELDDDHLSDLDQVERAAALLSGFTATPQDAWFCEWDGYSHSRIPHAVREHALVRVPHRSFAVLRGPLAAIAGWSTAVTSAPPAAPPAFVWPADRSWCLASDVDPHWAGVGGPAAAIEALLADPLLDVVAADPAAVQPAYR